MKRCGQPRNGRPADPVRRYRSVGATLAGLSQCGGPKDIGEEVRKLGLGKNCSGRGFRNRRRHAQIARGLAEGEPPCRERAARRGDRGPGRGRRLAPMGVKHPVGDKPVQNDATAPVAPCKTPPDQAIQSRPAKPRQRSGPRGRPEAARPSDGKPSTVTPFRIGKVWKTWRRTTARSGSASSPSPRPPSQAIQGHRPGRRTAACTRHGIKAGVERVRASAQHLVASGPEPRPVRRAVSRERRLGTTVQKQAQHLAGARCHVEREAVDPVASPVGTNARRPDSIRFNEEAVRPSVRRCACAGSRDGFGG